MPRKLLIRQNKFPYHVISRTNNKTWFDIPIEIVWDITKESFNYAQKKHSVIIHCFVLMNNHYHLLLTTPNSNIDLFMCSFNLKLSQLIAKSSGYINQKFSNRYKWSIVNTHCYLLNVYRYIYQNPVRAKISSDCISYKYSSLSYSSYESKIFNHQPHISYIKEKDWIEKRLGCDFDKVIKYSLRKSIFKPNNKISNYNKYFIEFPKSLSA